MKLEPWDESLLRQYQTALPAHEWQGFDQLVSDVMEKVDYEEDLREQLAIERRRAARAEDLCNQWRSVAIALSVGSLVLAVGFMVTR